MIRAVSRDQLKENLSLSIEAKEIHFATVFDVFYQRMNGNVYGAFSGGKGSTVMKFLIDKWCARYGYPPIRYVFNNTTNEHQEILDFVRSFGDCVHWIRPTWTFALSLLKRGFPLISKEQAMAISRFKKTKRPDQKVYRATGIKPNGTKGDVGVIRKKWFFLTEAPFEVTEQCCDTLKKAPVKKFEKETGLRPIIGTMLVDSLPRRLSYIKHGCNIFTPGKETCRPLSIFTEEDLEVLIKKYNIKICDIYFDQVIDGELVTGEGHTGCAWCGFGVQYEDPNNTRFHRLRKREPNRYKSMMDKLGYRKALEFIGIKLP